MALRWLILADDLTGAADCAIAFAKQGLESIVAWGDGYEGEASVLSMDVDSRRFPADAAASRQVAAQAAHGRRGARLYKKIDSTLRGQPAAELAAQLSSLARGKQRAPLAVVAPAFPATGRVTVNGRVLVNERPLEETPLWARDHTYACAFLPDVLATAGLDAEVIALDTIRSGIEAVHERMIATERRGIDAVVCDCASEADLAVVAAASLQLDDAVWVGSAGLAAALALLVSPAKPDSAPPPRHPGCVLMVVGSLAEASRLQAKELVRSGLVHAVSVTPETLLAGPQAPQWKTAHAALIEALSKNHDVLLTIATTPVDLIQGPDLSRGPALAARLAVLVEDAMPMVGALVATGGETACALLSHLGVHGIRLLHEVEPGVPLGVTLGGQSKPIITKAGAFGDADTLRRCLVHLKS